MSCLEPSKKEIFYLGIDGCIYSRDPFEEIEYETFTREEVEEGKTVQLEKEEKKVILKFRPGSETFLLDHSEWEKSITGSFRTVKSKSRNLD